MNTYKNRTIKYDQKSKFQTNIFIINIGKSNANNNNDINGCYAVVVLKAIIIEAAFIAKLFLYS